MGSDSHIKYNKRSSYIFKLLLLASLIVCCIVFLFSDDTKSGNNKNDMLVTIAGPHKFNNIDQDHIHLQNNNNNNNNNIIDEKKVEIDGGEHHAEREHLGAPIPEQEHLGAPIPPPPPPAADSNSNSNSNSNFVNNNNNNNNIKLPALSVKEKTKRMTNFLNHLHESYHTAKEKLNVTSVYEMYVQMAEKYLIPLDRDYEKPKINEQDETIFVSLASYRDENCPNTLNELYSHAKHPQNLYIGLVQQNCWKNCRSGVLDGGKVEDVEPDIDCYTEFCNHFDMGHLYCQENIRLLNVNESESLGPAVARFFASQLWNGENYFMQIDAHMRFLEDWDVKMINQHHSAPMSNAILTNYPASVDRKWKETNAPKLCEAHFEVDRKEDKQLIRLDGGTASNNDEHYPHFQPYVAAGYFFANGQFLIDIPYDPLLPWIFMGEEILLSVRAWTHGYDVFSPTVNLLSHIYVRRHKPKFWESVVREFRDATKDYNFHNHLVFYIIDRMKVVMKYPEVTEETLNSPLSSWENLYGIGNKRPLNEFYSLAGIDFEHRKISVPLRWCRENKIPQEVVKYMNADQLADAQKTSRKN